MSQKCKNKKLFHKFIFLRFKDTTAFKTLTLQLYVHFQCKSAYAWYFNKYITSCNITLPSKQLKSWCHDVCTVELFVQSEQLRSGPEFIKLSSFSTQLSMKFTLLINITRVATCHKCHKVSKNIKLIQGIYICIYVLIKIMVQLTKSCAQ